MLPDRLCSASSGQGEQSRRRRGRLARARPDVLTGFAIAAQFLHHLTLVRCYDSIPWTDLQCGAHDRGIFVYAVIETGGKQYRVTPGDVLLIEKLPVDPGTEYNFDRLLMVVGDEGARVIGTPYVDGARAVATVVDQERGEKILVFKYKPKSNYRRRQGHRQYLTRVRIDRIELPS